MPRHSAEWFRERLAAEKERLIQDKARLREHENMRSELGELANFDMNHPADMGSELFEREKKLALGENLDGILSQIEDALAKLDAGTYGACDHCGGRIADARLEALPYATLCIACQSRLET
jgi:RNA polymerase-binding protein DksA